MKKKNICCFSNFLFEFTMEVSHFLTIISFLCTQKLRQISYFKIWPPGAELKWSKSSFAIKNYKINLLYSFFWKDFLKKQNWNFKSHTIWSWLLPCHAHLLCVGWCLFVNNTCTCYYYTFGNFLPPPPCAMPNVIEIPFGSGEFSQNWFYLYFMRDIFLSARRLFGYFCTKRAPFRIFNRIFLECPRSPNEMCT